SILAAVELAGAHDHQLFQSLGNGAGIHHRAEVGHHGAHDLWAVGHGAEHVGNVAALAQKIVEHGLARSVNLGFLQPADAHGAHFLKAVIATASSSLTSKTVYSLVICSRSWTFLVSFNSLSSPP